MRENYQRRPTSPLILPFEDEFDPNGIGSDHPPEPLPLPEAELLRILERALQAQRMVQAQPEPQADDILSSEMDLAVANPLVNRIETILGKKLEAANDGRSTSQAPVDDVRMDDLIDDLAAAEFRTENATDIEDELQASPPRSLRSILVVGALCLVGVTGGMLIPTESPGFRAESVLAVQGGREERPALVTAARNALVSPRTIATAVTAMKLDHDSEFAGGDTDAFNVVVDLLSASGAATDPVSRAEASLAAAIHASTDANAGTVDFSVTTGSAAKSARIASYLVSTVSQPLPAAGATDGALKKASADADAELATFTEKNGEGNVQVATRLQQQIAEANAALQNAEQRVVTAKTQADLLKTATADDALTGVHAAQITSPVLEDRRNSYAMAKSTLAQLAASLGPRHPRLIAQQAEVDGLRDGISQEVSRLSRDAGDELKSAVASRRQLSDQRNALIAQSKDTGVDLARLAELRDKSSVAHHRLEDGIVTGAIPADGAHLVVLMAPQVAVVAPGRSPWFAPVLGGLAGLTFGLAGLWRRHAETIDETGPSEPIAFAEPIVDMPPEIAPEPMLAQTPDEVDILRAEIAAMRDRLKSYAATA
jgi:hypothetical protein